MAGRSIVMVCFALATLAGFGSVHAQQVYKWVDAAGTTHYTDHPPEKGTAKTLVLKGAPGAPLPVQPTASTDDKKVLDDAEVANRRRNCFTAQNNIKILQEEGAVLDGSDINTARPLDAQRRAKAKDDAMANIDKYCGPKP